MTADSDNRIFGKRPNFIPHAKAEFLSLPSADSQFFMHGAEFFRAQFHGTTQVGFDALSHFIQRALMTHGRGDSQTNP